MTAIATATVEAARGLWAAFRKAQSDRYYANVAVNEDNQSLIADLGIATPEGHADNCDTLRRADAAYDAALAALKAHYRDSYPNGLAVLEEYLAAVGDHANLQSNHAVFKAYSESGFSRRNEQLNAAAAGHVQVKIDPAQRRLDTAQAALDALTGGVSVTD